MLCWGVYRFKDSQNIGAKFTRPSNKRYVICNPDADFRMLPTDLVYVLQQFDSNPPSKRREGGLPKAPESNKKSPVAESNPSVIVTPRSVIRKDESIYSNTGSMNSKHGHDKYNVIVNNNKSTGRKNEKQQML